MPAVWDWWLPAAAGGVAGHAALLAGWVTSRGYAVDWKRVYPAGRMVALPAYPWQRERYWVETAGNGAARLSARMAAPGSEFSRFLGHRMRSPAVKEIVFEAELCTTSLPFLDDHRIAGEVVVPGACHLTRVLAAADAFPGRAVCAGGCNIPHARSPRGRRAHDAGDTNPDPRARSDPACSALPRSQASRMQAGAAAIGKLRTRQIELRSCAQERVPLEAIQSRCGEALAGAEFYADRETGYHLGPSFQWIEAIWRQMAKRSAGCACRRRQTRSRATSCIQGSSTLLPADRRNGARWRTRPICWVAMRSRADRRQVLPLLHST